MRHIELPVRSTATLTNVACGLREPRASAYASVRRKDIRSRGLAVEFAANWLDSRHFETYNSVDRDVGLPAARDYCSRRIFLCSVLHRTKNDPACSCVRFTLRSDVRSANTCGRWQAHSRRGLGRSWQYGWAREPHFRNCVEQNWQFCLRGGRKAFLFPYLDLNSFQGFLLRCF